MHIVTPVYAPRLFQARRHRPCTPLNLFATLISPRTTLSHTFLTTPDVKARKAYIHVVQTSGYNTKAATGASVKVSGLGDDGKPLEVLLKEGDGAYIFGEAGKEMKVENVGDKVAEVLLFDME